MENAPPAAASSAHSLGALRTASVGDRLLGGAARQGNRRALELICKKYREPLERYCRTLLGNPHDAADAVQATLATTLERLPGESRRIELRPWLYRIAHNEAVDLLRRRGRELPLNDATAVDGVEPTVPGPEAAAEVHERLTSLVDDLGRLPERQRGALVMRELGGLRHEEIATTLGTSTGAAKQAIYEARRSLTALDAGRQMPCQSVRRAISERDGRRLRARRMRAHLRACGECSSFRDAIATRRNDLGLVAGPIIATGALAKLRDLVFGTAGGSGAGSPAVGGGLGAGGVAATVKGAAAVAVVAGTISMVSGGAVPSLGFGAEAGGGNANAPEQLRGSTSSTTGEERVSARAQIATRGAQAPARADRKPKPATARGSRRIANPPGRHARPAAAGPPAGAPTPPAISRPSPPEGRGLGTGIADEVAPSPAPTPAPDTPEPPSGSEASPPSPPAGGPPSSLPPARGDRPPAAGAAGPPG